MRIEIPGRGKGIPRGASAKRLGSTQTSFLSPTPLDAIPRKKNPEPRIPTNRSHPAQVSPRRKRAGPKELRIEFLRKSIHLLIAAVPTLSTIDRGLAIALLFMGTLGYAIFETLRRRGIPIPLVSRITMLAARRRDSGKFVAGPVTLGLGALLSVILFQEPAASVAVYTLAFGDSLSSLVGKWFGRIPMPFTRGKSLEGSVACFAATLAAAWATTGSFGPSLWVALVATAVEAIPAKDWDNILLPLAVGMVASLVY
jgi:phytol kinase